MRFVPPADHEERGGEPRCRRQRERMVLTEDTPTDGQDLPVDVTRILVFHQPVQCNTELMACGRRVWMLLTQNAPSTRVDVSPQCACSFVFGEREEDDAEIVRGA